MSVDISISTSQCMTIYHFYHVMRQNIGICVNKYQRFCIISFYNHQRFIITRVFSFFAERDSYDFHMLTDS